MTKIPADRQRRLAANATRAPSGAQTGSSPVASVRTAPVATSATSTWHAPRPGHSEKRSRRLSPDHRSGLENAGRVRVSERTDAPSALATAASKPYGVLRQNAIDPLECRRYVEENFAPERMVADYAKAYEEAVERAAVA